MFRFKLNTITKTLILTSPLLLAACGSGGGGSGGSDSSGGGNRLVAHYTVINPQVLNNFRYVVEKLSVHNLPQYITRGGSPYQSPLTVSEKINGKYDGNLNTVSRIVSEAFNVSAINANNFKSHIDKNVKDLPSFYNTVSTEGTFTKEYVKSLREEIAKTSSYENRSGISQDVNPYYPAGKAFLYNTGLVDTSATWNKAKVDAVFNWDRLERDYIAPINDITSNGLIRDPQMFDYLMNDEAAKVLVIDTSLAKSLNFDYNRFKYEYYYDEKDLSGDKSAQNDQNIYHGDIVTYMMAGKPYDTNFSNKTIENDTNLNWHSKGVQYFTPGFMTNKGTFAFFGDSKNGEAGGVSGSGIINDPKTLDLVKKGYKIINMSFSRAYDLATLEKYKKEQGTNSYTEALRKMLFHSSQGYIDLVDNDALLLFAAGNDYGKAISLEAAYPLINTRGNMIDGSILVVSYNPLTGEKSDYSNECLESKYYCLAANSRMLLQYNEKRDNAILNGSYTAGTSTATPYVSSTAALVKSVFPFFTNHNLKTTLLTTALDKGAVGVDSVYGWGLVQPHKAVHGPAQFFDKDFTVNLGHDSHLVKKNGIYRFANDISGKFGLVVKNTSDNNAMLSLSGRNTYKGNTVLEKGALVNIDGINENKVIVNEGARLYGSGKIDSLYNAGNVYNYSAFKNISPKDRRSQYGMVIEGNYEQAHTGTLITALGQPLLVKGFAILDGGLKIDGIQQGYISKHGKVFEDVLVSQKGIAGKFQSISLPHNLTNGKITYNSMNLGDSPLYTVSVFADYFGIDNDLYGFEAAGYNISEETKKTLVSLDERLNRYIDESSESVKDTVAKMDVHSGLTKIMADIQSSSQSIDNILSVLEDKELRDSLKENRYLNTLNRFNFINANLLSKGVNLSYKGDYTDHTLKGTQNYLDFTYNVGGRKLGLQITEGKHDNELNGTSVYKNKGIQGLVGKEFGRFGVNVIAGFNQFKNNLAREHLGETANNIFKNNHYHVGVFADTQFGQFKPYVGYAFDYVKLKGYQEQYADYKLSINKQSTNTHSLFAGVNFTQPIFAGVDLKLDYFIKTNLDKHEPLKGSLYDNMLSSDLYVKGSQYDTIQVAKLALEKQFANWNVELSTSYLHNNSSNMHYGLKVGYTFK